MSTSKKSIITDDLTQCYICGNPFVELHHVCFGTANRKLSDKYGLIIPLCAEHHRGNKGVHQDRALDLFLKRMAQEKFEEVYDEDFIKIFGRRYK